MRRIHLDPGALLDLPIGVSSSAWTEALGRHGLAADLRGVPDDLDAQGASPVAELRRLQRLVHSLPASDARMQELGLPLPLLTGRISWRALAAANRIAILAVGACLLRLKFPLTPAIALVAGLLLYRLVRHHQAQTAAYDAERALRAALVDNIREIARSLANQSFYIERGADRLVHTPAQRWLRQEAQSARLQGDRDRLARLQAQEEAIQARLEAPGESGGPSWSTDGLVPDLNMCAAGAVAMALDKPAGDNKGGDEGRPLPSIPGRQCFDG